MKKEVFDLIKRELFYLGLVLIFALIAFKIAFYKENVFVVIRSVASFFLAFVLPGYIVMLYWHEKLEFFERLLFGAMLNTAIIGISSYYLGIMGLNIEYHIFILPLLISVIGMILVFRKFKT